MKQYAVKFPDKIYIHRTEHLGLLSGTEIPVDAPEEKEYVRKDVVADYLKERQLLQPHDYTEVAEELQMAIDKVTEL